MIDHISQESSILDGDLVIGEFVIRPLLKTVRPASSPKGSDEQSLPDKAVAVLLYLAQNARQVCERDDILDTVWGEDRDAYDRVLDNAVAEIRRVLNDDARNPKYIQTVPRRGYRLLLPVHARQPRFALPPDSESPQALHADPPPRRSIEAVPHESTPATGTEPSPAPRFARAAWAVGAALGLTTLALMAYLWPQPATDAVRVEVRPSAWQLEVEAELASKARQALFDTHPCGERSLVTPVTGISPADVTLTVSAEREDGRNMLRVRHSDPSIPAVLAQLQGPAGDPAGDVSTVDELDGANLGRFLTNVSAMIDRQICFEEGLPASRRACHCRAATTRTFHRMGQPEPHIELLEQAIELDPGDVDSYEALAMIYRSLGEGEDARNTLTAGLARIEDPTSVPALSLRRRLAEMLGDYEMERIVIDQLRVLRPDEPRWILAQAAHVARHRRDCQQALQLVASFGDAQPSPEATRLEASESIWTCLLHSDRQEADRQRLAQAPQDAGTRFQLALGSVLSGHLDEAQRLANEHLALEPESADAYWLLASLAGRQGAYSAARHWLAQMKERIEWPNQDLRYRTTMGWTDLRDGNVEGCLEEFADMPEGSRDWSVMARWTFGRCQIRAGDLAAAGETLTELRDEQAATRSLWQEEFVLHLEASLMAAESDQPEARRLAAEKMIQATELLPADYPYFATEAGLLLESAGDRQRAREFYERAVAFSPSYPWGNCRLGLLYRRLGRSDEAVKHLRLALDVLGDPPEGPLGLECAAALAESSS